MRVRTSGALSLLVAGILVITPVVGSAAFADDLAPAPSTSSDSSVTPVVDDPAPAPVDPTPVVVPVDPTPVVVPLDPAPVVVPTPPVVPTLPVPVVPTLPNIVLPTLPNIAPALPSAPDAPSVVRRTDRTGVTVSWLAPEAGTSPITRYTILIETADGVSIPGYTVPGSDSSILITDPAFEVGIDYDLSVFATSALGDGAASETTSFFLDSVDPSAPTNVQLTPASDGSGFDASWNAPSYDGGVPLLGYDVYVIGLGVEVGYYYDSFTTTSAFLPLNEFVTAGVAYTLVVFAVNSDYLETAGFSDPATVALPVVVAAVPDAPTNVTAIPVGHHDPAIHVIWDDSVTNGSDVTGYVVTLLRNGVAVQTHELSIDELDGDDFDSFSGVIGDANYSVDVTAVSAVGDSATSSAAVTTLAVTPTAPSALTVDSGQDIGLDLTISGSTVVAHVLSALPGEWVFGYAYSTPTALGWAQVDSAGNATWTLPTLPAGLHHIAVLDNDGSFIGLKSFTIAGTATAVVVPAAAAVTAAASSLPFTGFDATAPLAAGALSLLLGLVLFLFTRVRRASAID